MTQITENGTDYALLEEHNLQCVNPANNRNRNKFWTVLVLRDNGSARQTRFALKTIWGRIGTEGQDQLVEKLTRMEVDNYLYYKMGEKKKKGYTVVSVGHHPTVKNVTPEKVKTPVVETEWDLT